MLAVDNITFSRNGRRLLGETTFCVNGGDFVMITGDNGAGKTTLLKILCGLLAADDGRVRRQIAVDEMLYVGHQNAIKQTLNARENLFRSAALRGQKTAATVIAAAIAAAGLAAVQELPARLLSAGQQRRVALSRLFAFPAKLWILDEPLANADDDTRRLLFGELQKHLQNGGGAVVANHRQHWRPSPAVTLRLSCPS